MVNRLTTPYEHLSLPPQEEQTLSLSHELTGSALQTHAAAMSALAVLGATGDLNEVCTLAPLKGLDLPPSGAHIILFSKDKPSVASADSVILSQTSGLTVIAASKDGNLHKLRSIFSKGGSILHNDLGEAVVKSVARGHIEATRFLLDQFPKNHPISPNDLGLALATAIEKDFLDIFDILNSGNPFRLPDSFELEWQVVEVSSKGHQQILRLLLSVQPKIRAPHLRAAVTKAVENNQAESISLLLSDGRDVSKEALGKEVQNASQMGHDKVIQALLSNGRDISEKDLASAFYGGASSNKVKTLLLLLEAGTIPQETLGDVLKTASAQGYIEVVEFLLTLPILESHLSKSLELASYHGHLKTVLSLLSTSPFTQEKLGKAVVETTKGLMAYIKNAYKYIPDDYVKILEELLNHGPISESSKQSAISQACDLAKIAHGPVEPVAQMILCKVRSAKVL